MILVCCHKYLPQNHNDLHIPIQVGAAISKTDLAVTRDDSGDNISNLNPYFCELTALYWVWKNAPRNDEFYGLEHYRRFFSKPSIFGSKIKYTDASHFSPLTEKQIRRYLNGYDIILAKQDVFPIRNYSDYAMKHERRDIDILRAVIEELSPDSITAYDEVMLNSNRISAYNMFISSRSFLDSYCEWLFPILFEVQKRVDISNYDTYQKRIFGFMSERLLNVFVRYKNLRVHYLPIAYFDKAPSLAVRIGHRILRAIDTFRFQIVKQKKY